MKNINWILHAVSLIAIAFLLFQNRNQSKSSNVAAPVTSGTNASGGQAPIAYFMSDSLMSQLNFFKKNEAELKAKQEKMQNELRGKESTFQKEVQRLQANAQNLTRNELEAGQKRLAQMEQDFMERKEKLAAQLADETGEFNEKLHLKVINYLKEINADRRYSYVVSVVGGGQIFYADTAYDITAQMVKDLNERYSE